MPLGSGVKRCALKHVQSIERLRPGPHNSCTFYILARKSPGSLRSGEVGVKMMVSTFILAGLASVSAACLDYAAYSQTKHEPVSAGELQLSAARPPRECRTFTSSVVEQEIDDITKRIRLPDLARLFENCFPNTLDTTIKFNNSTQKGEEQSFVVTGDIDAMWLRDSAQQLHPYRHFITKDEAVAGLFRGVINAQVEYILQFPYCNSFQPSKGAQEVDLKPTVNPWAKDDVVLPPYNDQVVFECKYELDSLANFLQLSTDYFEEAEDPLFFDKGWLDAVKVVLKVLRNEAMPTYLLDGSINREVYQFQREDTSASETFNNRGYGNPVQQFGSGTLIRSGFRPSDDATIFQYLIPSNAFMSVMLSRASQIASSLVVGKETTFEMESTAKAIRQGIEIHAVVRSPNYGKVYAYEVDGFGGAVVMDDANYPNLMGLPLMGFLPRNDTIYQNTRKMILARNGNPYYSEGEFFKGVGSPHTGLGRAWPLSLLTTIQTSTNRSEVEHLLSLVLDSTAGLGLMHESVNVNNLTDYTRPWFSWANGVLGTTVLDVLDRFPGLID